jgi:hypothetical protein
VGALETSNQVQGSTLWENKVFGVVRTSKSRSSEEISAISFCQFVDRRIGEPLGNSKFGFPEVRRSQRVKISEAQSTKYL